MANAQEIAKVVHHGVSIYGGIDESEITDDMKLGDDLNFDDQGYSSLTLSLRAYVKYQKPVNTVLLSEVSKSSQTVGGLITLVTQKV